MKFEEIYKDLFTTFHDWALAHCISKDGAMGIHPTTGKRYGIAALFSDKFPQMRTDYKKLSHRVGEAWKWENEERVVFNLITKEQFWGKPSYDTVEMALKDMKEQVLSHHILKIAMPIIASDLDKLEWEKVRDIIQEVFQDTEVEILVCKVEQRYRKK